MENIDRGLEQRVWQRVHGGQEAQEPSLQALAAAERSAAAVYLMLSRSAQGSRKEKLRKLYQRDKAHGECLKGMQLCAAGTPLSARPAPPVPERPEIALRKCYAGCLRAAAQYESRAADPEYGPVFAHLARQEQENCAMILELLGELGR